MRLALIVSLQISIMAVMTDEMRRFLYRWPFVVRLSVTIGYFGVVIGDRMVSDILNFFHSPLLLPFLYDRF